MRWFRRKSKPTPKPRFRDDCPACGWVVYGPNACAASYRDWEYAWLPEEQAVLVTCPSCCYTWKRLADDPVQAFNLVTRFEEKS